MRTCSEIERDLTAARSRFTAAEAVIAGGSRTAATYHEAAEAQAEVRRLEAELVALPPVTGAPVRRPRPTTPPAGGAPPAGTTTPTRGTTAAPPPVVVTPPVSTVTTPPPTPVVRRRRATSTRRTPPPVVCTPYGGLRSWLWFAAVVVGVLLLVAFANQQGRGSYPSAPATTVRTTPTSATRPESWQLSTYRDCLEKFGERRELDDGRCDHLP